MYKPDVTTMIDEAYLKEEEPKARQYIGASNIGGKCDAEIAFSLRGFPGTAPEPKLKRIFKAGHRIEVWVIADMKKAGIHVMEADPLTGKQYAYHLYGGHCSGHADGLIEHTPDDVGLLEVKSMNDAKWKDYRDKSVRYSHPNYYKQVQFMMGMSGLKWCLFIAYNKNNSLYHHEYVEFDEFTYAASVVRAEHIMRGDAERCATDRSDWRCKGCFKLDVCWGELKPPPACLVCQHARPLRSGSWECGKGRAYGVVCSDYQLYNPKTSST